MNKQTTTLAGVAAVVAIVAATLMLGVLPQWRAASEAKTSQSELTQTNSLLTVQLASLAQQSKDREGLDKELALLRSQVPATADLASVTRVIVNALQAPDGTQGATLVSITPQVPPVAFVPREQLTLEVGEPPVPQLAPPGLTDAEPVTGFQEIPLTITATAVDMRAAFRFVDLLNDGPRLLAVHHVQISQDTSVSGTPAGQPVTISVAGAAYLKPAVGAAPAGAAG